MYSVTTWYYMFMYIEYIVSCMADIFHWYDKSISDLISDFADKKAVEGFDILYILYQ